jgi:hypothetical protein
MDMTFSAGKHIHRDLGTWKKDELERLIREAATIKSAGQRIRFLSDAFLGLGYKKASLTGNNSTSEVFTVDLSGVDCFTFLDYIEAMRLSDSFEEFLENLQKVRYRENRVEFINRKHFFTDWSSYAPATVSDVTELIGGRKVKTSLKTLNLKKDGTLLLPGLPPCQRRINYLPPEETGEAEICNLETGDYAGIYSALQGLDVSHVGIVIRAGKKVNFRHASSDKRYRKVIDQDLQAYLKGKPGLIILRPADYCPERFRG